MTPPLLTMVEARVSDLHPSPRNPRTITKERFDALCKSLREAPDHLIARPVIALPTGEVLAGNMRLRAAQAIGRETVPCVYMDLDERRQRELLLRDNASYGEWDDQALAEMLYELGAETAGDFTFTGFSDEEITRLLAEVSPEGGDIAVPDAPAFSHTCPKCGHTWEEA